MVGSIAYAVFLGTVDWFSREFKPMSLSFWTVFRLLQCTMNMLMLLALNPYPKRMLQGIFYCKYTPSTTGTGQETGGRSGSYASFR